MWCLRAGVRPVPLDIHIMGFDIVNFDARLQAMSRPTYSALVSASAQVQHVVLQLCALVLLGCKQAWARPSCTTPPSSTPASKSDLVSADAWTAVIRVGRALHSIGIHMGFIQYCACTFVRRQQHEQAGGCLETACDAGLTVCIAVSAESVEHRVCADTEARAHDDDGDPGVRSRRRPAQALPAGQLK